jgi:hypothetical protein
MLYFQIDYTLGPNPDGTGLLHATFRRENPTTIGHDFTIAGGLDGPGRFLGCAVGVRTIDAGTWYGEGEVKIYRDGDTSHPTICGTGLEDYVGSAWGMGVHHALYGGVPLEVRAPDARDRLPDFVGFYRWHVPDPIVFTSSLRVTIQQIGMHLFAAGDEATRDAYAASNPVAGNGWLTPVPESLCGMALFERVDDYCATAFVYCAAAQPVPRVDVGAATADLARREHEHPDQFESMFGTVAQ